MGKIFSHEERLELTRRKMAFREMIRHSHEVPAAPGVLEHPEPEFDGIHCLDCGSTDLVRWESCYRCRKCGWSKC